MNQANYPRADTQKKKKKLRNPLKGTQAKLLPINLSVPTDRWFYHPLIMKTRMTRVPPKKSVSRSKLNFINQLLYIQCPIKERQIITSRRNGPHHRLSDQQKTTPKTSRKHTTPLKKT